MATRAKLSLKSRTDGKAFDAVVSRSKPGGVKVGFVKGLGKHPGSDATISEIAAYNEFGTSTSGGQEHIPERPFLRTTISEQSKTVYVPLTAKLLGLVLDGTLTVNQAIGILGEKAVADVKMKIDAISDPPNADSTVDRKGSTNPLIDTGLMRQSVSWELVE